MKKKLFLVTNTLSTGKVGLSSVYGFVSIGPQESAVVREVTETIHKLRTNGAVSVEVVPDELRRLLPRNPCISIYSPK